MKNAHGRLALGQILALPLDGQLRVACDAGLLWVTGEATGDVLLYTGYSTVMSGRGRVVLEALEPAQYSIRECR